MRGSKRDEGEAVGYTRVRERGRKNRGDKRRRGRGGRERLTN